ncbi:MAG TPA: extracellular solute-binding protein, partial [Chloroflexota bacterium]|nr:extracellular solute-binding protein [Chloroflexota bacterium]
GGAARGAARGGTRRLVLQLGAGAAGVGAAAACTAGQPAGSSQDTSGAQRPAQRPVTLQVWEHSLFKWREDVGQQITDPLLAANPWLTLDVSVPAGNAWEKFQASSAAGTPPDTYTQAGYWAQQDLVDGHTISLERYLKASRVLRKADLWESLRRDLEFEGHLTSIPFAPDTRILFTHVENARKAGLDPQKPPAKWSEIEGASLNAFRGAAGTVEHIGWYPFLGSGGPYLWMVPYWQIGGELLNPDRTKITIANERATRALSWLKRVVDRQGGYQAIEEFRKRFTSTAGESVFMEGGTTFLYATLSSRGEQFNLRAPTMQFTVSTYPLPDEGGTTANYGGIWGLPIAKGSKHQDETWRFIEHVTSPEHNLKFALRFDRVPIRESTTRSQDYIGNDRGRALQAEEMKKRRQVIHAPGSGEMLPHQDVMTPVLKGEQSIQDALAEKERLLQQILDTYLARAKDLKLS